MKSRSRSMIVAALAAMIFASPAQAGGLKQVAEISIPGAPITDIGIMAIDQTTGLGYLADKTNKSVVVFDTKTDKFVARIPGFVGLLKDGNASGPNGVVVVGAEVWVSDGDSTIKVVDTKTGQITGTIATGGRCRSEDHRQQQNEYGAHASHQEPLPMWPTFDRPHVDPTQGLLRKSSVPSKHLVTTRPGPSSVDR